MGDAIKHLLWVGIVIIVLIFVFESKCDPVKKSISNCEQALDQCVDQNRRMHKQVKKCQKHIGTM